MSRIESPLASIPPNTPVEALMRAGAAGPLGDVDEVASGVALPAAFSTAQVRAMADECGVTGTVQALHRFAVAAAAAGVMASDAPSVTLSAEDAHFLAVRLRRLCAHLNYSLPKFADDDASLINIAGTVVGALLTNLTHGVAPTAEAQRNADFEAGWRTAAEWARRDDLIADIGSPAYIGDRAEALARGVLASDGGQPDA